MSVIIAEHEVAAPGGWGGDGIYGTWEKSQSFLAATSGYCALVRLKLKRGTNDTDNGENIYAKIFADDGTGKPTGPELASGSVLRSVVPDDAVPFDWVSFTFAVPALLLTGVTYVVTCSAPTITQNSSYGITWEASGGDEYAGGLMGYSTDSGSSWLTRTADKSFEISGEFSPLGVVPTDVVYTKKLVAVGNNQLWYEQAAGVMVELTSATDDIDCSNLLNIFEGYGKVFVANKDNLKVADFQNSKITTADVVSGGVYPQFGVLLTGGSSGAAMVVDYITSLSGACTIYGTSITAATFTSGETVTGTNPDESSVSFATNSIEVAAPHWYDWTPYGNDSTFGAMPSRATLGCLFRGRAVISGNNLAPHQWYMSRQADPFNWLYGINDAQSAVAGNNTDAGEVGDIVTALIPYKDDFLIFGCVDSMWYMTGDPTAGGSLDELDLTTGVFGANSWCWGEDDVLYFWGLNGIYKVALPGGTPNCLSEIRLPALIGEEAADPTTHRITMAYDKRRAGILTTITKLSDGSNSCYWYDFRTNGFFPESYPDTSGIYSSTQYNAFDSDYKQVMYGCQDGHIRFHDDTVKDDDTAEGTAAISSYVTFGPFLLAKWAGDEGKITGFDLILGGGGSSPESDGASYEFYTGKSAQEVVKKMAAGTPIAAAGSTTGSGRSRKTFKRKIRGVYCGLKIKNATLAQTWAMEQALITIAQGGRLR